MFFKKVVSEEFIEKLNNSINKTMYEGPFHVSFIKKLKFSLKIEEDTEFLIEVMAYNERFTFIIKYKFLNIIDLPKIIKEEVYFQLERKDKLTFAQSLRKKAFENVNKHNLTLSQLKLEEENDKFYLCLPVYFEDVTEELVLEFKQLKIKYNL